MILFISFCKSKILTEYAAPTVAVSLILKQKGGNHDERCKIEFE